MENSRNKWSEEFQEEEIWGVLNDTKDSSDYSWTGGWCSSSSSSSFKLKAATAKRMMIPKSEKKAEELSGIMSAPVNILPAADWSEISCRKPRSSWLDDDDDEYSDDEEEERGSSSSVNAIIPPHEVIARRQITSFSVFEGVGRTLKGRDLSRVRNAVLTKTGFLESKSHHYPL